MAINRISEVFKALKTSPSGLASAEARSRLESHGKNCLKKQKRQSFLKRFFAAMNDKLIIILLVAALISFVCDLVSGSLSADAPIILAIVLLNTFIAVIQESRAEKAIDALRSLSSERCTVIRDGREQLIDSTDIVVGDIVVIHKGERVPADMRIFEQSGLMADESMLTGESAPVSKTADDLPAAEHPAEMHNMLFSSTLVTAGRGRAVVVNVGMNTFVGSVAEMLSSKPPEQTPLQRRLAGIGNMLGNFALAICAIIFIISIIRGLPPAEMFVTGVGLAVAAIPEGLPAIVTVVLSTGVKTMAAQRAAVRRLTAVETLGSATVICSDKTGTLTMNKMTVTKTYGDEDMIKQIIAACPGATGGTEDALLAYCGLRETSTPLCELPFDSETKFTAAVHRTHEKYVLYVRGAPEKILQRCRDGEEYMLLASKMASEGSRVVAFGYCESEKMPDMLSSPLVSAGVVGMSDPPREGTRDAVELCRRAGVRTVMITGDHKDTALSVAKQIGIYRQGDSVHTENELSPLSGEAFAAEVARTTVFARTTPAFKLRIVEALQSRGETVAMTGDGVNDAPALRKADIGCAMGLSGTDVAKEAADLVLTDDDFGTIAAAVREGRGLLANIKRSVHFLLSCNIGELLCVFAALVIGMPPPLGAVQLLWINLVTDSLPAIALGLESTDPDVMKRRPIRRDAPLFGGRCIFEMCTEGLLIGLVSLLAMLFGSGTSPEVGKTMCFAVMSISELLHCFNMRTRKAAIKAHLPKNPFIFPAFLICLCMQLSVMLIPSLRVLFGCAELDIMQWLAVLMLSAVILPACEIYKLLTKSKD